MKDRMRKLFESINKLGKGFHVYITQKYLDLKLKELILEYAYQTSSIGKRLSPLTLLVVLFFGSLVIFLSCYKMLRQLVQHQTFTRSVIVAPQTTFTLVVK